MATQHGHFLVIDLMVDGRDTGHQASKQCRIGQIIRVGFECKLLSFELPANLKEDLVVQKVVELFTPIGSLNRFKNRFLKQSLNTVRDRRGRP